MGEAYIIRKNGNIIGVQLCEQVDNVAVSPAYLANVLTWSKPLKDQNNSYAGVRIVAKKDSCPSGINDGEVVYEGNDLEFTHSNLIEGDTWYYRFFAYTSDKFYQTSMRYVYQQVLAGYVWKKYSTKEVTQDRLLQQDGSSRTFLIGIEQKTVSPISYATTSAAWIHYASNVPSFTSDGKSVILPYVLNPIENQYSIIALPSQYQNFPDYFKSYYSTLVGKYVYSDIYSSDTNYEISFCEKITSSTIIVEDDSDDPDITRYYMNSVTYKPERVTYTAMDKYIESVMDLDSNTYPSNGIHTDGYWYVLQAS